MRRQKITLEKAIQLEKNKEIFIYFTNKIDTEFKSDPIWYQNWYDLANKYRKIDIGQLLEYLDPEYEIEVDVPLNEETGIKQWIYLYGKKQKAKLKMDQSSTDGRYVYILTNPAYPTLCKIGKAINPQKRVKQINSAGIVSEWKLVYALPVVDDYLVEFLVHKHLSFCRCDTHQGTSREFFEIELNEAIKTIENLGKDFKKGEGIYYE